jgi:hypothetical protein
VLIFKIVIDCVMCYGVLNPLGVAILKWEIDAYLFLK